MKFKILELKISDKKSSNGLFEVKGVAVDVENNKKMNFKCYTKDYIHFLNMSDVGENHIGLGVNMEQVDGNFITFTYIK